MAIFNSKLLVITRGYIAEVRIGLYILLITLRTGWAARGQGMPIPGVLSWFVISQIWWNPQFFVAGEVLPRYNAVHPPVLSWIITPWTSWKYLPQSMKLLQINQHLAIINHQQPLNSRQAVGEITICLPEETFSSRHQEEQNDSETQNEASEDPALRRFNLLTGELERRRSLGDLKHGWIP